ncbi:MAG: DEAD/DEAH box helicase family protein [Desulfitobacteriia bacterium]|jgi:superfamily II DNA or RNA helicase
MSFIKLSIKREYRTLNDNMVRDFYIPLLNEAVLYQRAVGFFSSTALIQVSSGITGLVKNSGKIQLIASPRLSAEDIEAINKGYEARENIVERAILREFSEPKTYFEKERLNLLANLISSEHLDIKIAFTLNKNNLGIFHEKMGLLYDAYGYIIAFSGSMNETISGIMENYEAIDVYCSWQSEFEKNKVNDKLAAFNRLWNDNEPNVRIIDFPKVAYDKLQSYKQQTVNLNLDMDEVREDEIRYVVEEKILGPRVPKDVSFYQYQLEAISEWAKRGYRGIFDMATGTGKTFTGLGAITALSEQVSHKLAVIIVCPYQHLVEQWIEDITKFNMAPIIGYSASMQKDWKRRLEDAVRDQKLKVRNREFFCLVCTNATFASEFVQYQINKIRGNILLVVDEAHNFGAERLSRLLNEKIPYRLALSATLERHNDEEGTERLFSYFGEKCIEYPLERAIEEKKLTKYKYYPIIVTLNEQELELYTQLSYEIGKCLIKGRNGKLKLNEKGKILAIKRARLVAGAKDKINKLEDCITPYLHDKHILVYCGATNMLREDQDSTSIDEDDLRQIDVITDLLGNKLNMKVSQFTSREDVVEREVLKREFAAGDNLQALIAIKCLDEGVNIPKIKVAFILASTTNPKEYIQRRGRVLRLAEGKEYAEIYDFITLPRALDDVPSLTRDQMNKELSLVKNELSRAKEFARIAMNMVEAESVLDEIKEAYSINDNLFAFEGEEEYDYE